MFLTSPQKLVNALKNSALVDDVKKKSTEWYFSSKGKEEYDKADTLPKKTEYFYNYLLSLSEDKLKDETSSFVVSHFKDKLYKIGYIIAHSVAGTSLPFAKYPDILDENKNPLITYVGEMSNPDNSEGVVFEEMYAASNILCTVYDALKINNKDKLLRSYKKLEKPADDGSVSDLYKLERDIIWIFRFEEDAFPYKFSNEKITEMLSVEEEFETLKKVLEEEKKNG